MTLHRLKSLEFIRVYLAWKCHLTFSQTQMITTIECFLAGLIASMVLGVMVRHFLLFLCLLQPARWHDLVEANGHALLA